MTSLYGILLLFRRSRPSRLAFTAVAHSFLFSPPRIPNTHIIPSYIFRAALTLRIIMKFELDSLVLLASIAVVANCQNQASCYYPNGDLSKENDIPCSSAPGSACCPMNWQCLDNGLCYLDNAQYYGRYTCTDKSWKSSGCPQICTHSKDMRSSPNVRIALSYYSVLTSE